MRNFIVLISFLHAFSSIDSQCERPSIDQVVYEYSKNYKYGYNEAGDFAVIAYKPTGIYIIHKNVYSNKEVMSELFYNQKTCKYQKLDSVWNSSIDPDQMNENYSEMIGAAFKANYERIKYYGYDSFYFDMIQEFGNRNIDSLKDRELEGLARTYSQLATEMCINMSGDKHSKLKSSVYYSLETNRQRRLDSMFKYRELTRILLDKLCEKFPNYKTIVGNSCAKLFGELNHAVMQFEREGDTQKANYFFNKIESDSFYLKLSKSTLEDLEPNSILLTYGDFDTYPILFCQKKYNYRKDIIIINISLIEDSGYAKSVLQRLGIRLNYGIYARYWKPLEAENNADITLKSFLNILEKDSENYFNPCIATLNSKKIPFLIPGLKNNNQMMIKIDKDLSAGMVVILTIIHNHFEKVSLYQMSGVPLPFSINSIDNGIVARYYPVTDENAKTEYTKNQILKKFKSMCIGSSKIKLDPSFLTTYAYNSLIYIDAIESKEEKKRVYKSIKAEIEKEDNKEALLSLIQIEALLEKKEEAENHLEDYYQYVLSNPSDNLPHIFETELIKSKKIIENLASNFELKLPY